MDWFEWAWGHSVKGLRVGPLVVLVVWLGRWVWSVGWRNRPVWVWRAPSRNCLDGAPEGEDQFPIFGGDADTGPEMENPIAGEPEPTMQERLERDTRLNGLIAEAIRGHADYTEGGLPHGRVWNVTVGHDSWCPALHGEVCECEPELTVVPSALRVH